MYKHKKILCIIPARGGSKGLPWKNIKKLFGEPLITYTIEHAKRSKYLDRISRGDIKHGPFFPKTPDRIFRRAVRGMLPRKKAKGRVAFKNLKAFIGLPEEFKNKNFEKIKAKDASSLKTKYITLGEISTAIGARKRW